MGTFYPSGIQTSKDLEEDSDSVNCRTALKGQHFGIRRSDRVSLAENAV